VIANFRVSQCKTIVDEHFDKMAVKASFEDMASVDVFRFDLRPYTRLRPFSLPKVNEVIDLDDQPW